MLLISSCEKLTKDDPEEPGGPETEVEISIEEPNVHANQLVILKTQRNYDDFTGKIGAKEIKIKAISDTVAGFIATDLPLGKQTLKTNYGDISLNILASTPLTEKQAFDGLESNLTILKSLSLSDVQKKEITDFQGQVKKLFSSLTSAQKTEALAIYSANRKEIIELKTVIKSIPMQVIQEHNSNFALLSKEELEKQNVGIKSSIDTKAANNSQNIAANNTQTFISKACHSQFPKNIEQQMGCSVTPLNTQFSKLIKPLMDLYLYGHISEIIVWMGPDSEEIKSIPGSISVAAASFMLYSELKPYIAISFDNAEKFLAEPWILEKIGSKNETQIIEAERNYPLKNYYGMRPLWHTDEFSGNISTFNSLYVIIADLIRPMRQVLGKIPDYIVKRSVINSEKIEWKVSEISNSKVKLKEIKKHNLLFDLEQSTTENFDYLLHANFLGQKDDAKMTAMIEKVITDDYTILFANTYNPDYSKITHFTTYKVSDVINVHSNVIYHYKILYKGKPVTKLNNPLFFNINQITFGEAPKNNKEINIDEYELKFYDELNQKYVTLRLKVKISNAAFDRINNQTLVVVNPYYWDASPMYYTFHSDGKLTIDLPSQNFKRGATWNFEIHTASDYTLCTDGRELNKAAIAAVKINIKSVDVSPYIIIYKDGSYGGSGSQPCHPGYTVKLKDK